MAKLSIGQKAERVLKLLLGLRHPAVASALARYGFTQATLEEGWSHLRNQISGRLSQRPPPREDPLLVRRLDDWENQWFPIASATLCTRFPEVHEHLFMNLAQTEGPAVVIGVGTFVRRLDGLASEPALARGAEARELLEKRGFTAANLAVARDLLKAVHSVAAAQPAPSVDLAAQEAVEKAMWEWYLEWGEIARAAIKDRRLLRELGFLSTKRAAKAPADEGAAAEPDESAA